MKIIRKLLLYTSFFIIGFSIPLFLYFSNSEHKSFLDFFSRSNVPKDETLETPQTSIPDIDFSEDVPLYNNANIINLFHLKGNNLSLQKECAKEIPEYGKKTRYEWAKMLSISQLVKKKSNQLYLEITVDNSIWDNSPIDVQQHIIANLFYCYPASKKPQYALVLDAESSDQLANFDPNSPSGFLIKTQNED